MGNGVHARAAPGGVKVHHDNFAFDVSRGNAAVDPIPDVKCRHGLAFESSMGGASLRVLVPSPTVGKFSGGGGQNVEDDQTDETERSFCYHTVAVVNISRTAWQPPCQSKLPAP